MADLHFPAELPIQCVRDLVAAVRAGDYTSAATVDHALYAAGCVNALRGPQPFGAADEATDADGVKLKKLTDDELCDVAEAELPQGFGAVGDAAAVNPLLLLAIRELLSRVLDKWLRR